MYARLTPHDLAEQPFVQRVWLALEEKGIDYQYKEVNPYKKVRCSTRAKHEDAADIIPMRRVP